MTPTFSSSAVTEISSSSRRSRKSSPSSKSARHSTASRDEYRTVSLNPASSSDRDYCLSGRRQLVASPDPYGGDPYADHHQHLDPSHHPSMLEHHHHKSTSSSKREHHQGGPASPSTQQSLYQTQHVSSRSQHHAVDDPRTERDVYQALHGSGEKGQCSHSWQLLVAEILTIKII